MIKRLLCRIFGHSPMVPNIGPRGDEYTVCNRCTAWWVKVDGKWEKQ